MTLTSAELWKRIAASGLASSDQARQWASEVAQSMSAAELADGHRLLDRLVADGKVTDFQAEKLSRDEAAQLKRGIWLLRSEVDAPLWSGWYEAEAGGQQRYVRWLDPDFVESLKTFRPSWTRAEKLCRLAAPGLMPLASIATTDGAMQLAHPVALGHLIQPTRRSDATNVVREIATALAALHKENIVHGRVMPDRILMTEAGKVCLIVDPICASTSRSDESGRCGVFPNLLESRSGGKRQAGNGPCEEQFHAPEFTSPGQHATMASDVYALGCLWWQLATGQPLVASGDSIEMMSAHCEELPSVPANTPLSADAVKCLRGCLGRNLNGRFRSAIELLAALDAMDSPCQPDAATVAVTSPELSTPPETKASPTAADQIKTTKAESAPQSNEKESTKKSTSKPKAKKPTVVPATAKPSRESKQPQRADAKPVTAKAVTKSPRTDEKAPSGSAIVEPEAKVVVEPEAKVTGAKKSPTAQPVPLEQQLKNQPKVHSGKSQAEATHQKGSSPARVPAAGQSESAKETAESSLIKQMAAPGSPARGATRSKKRKKGAGWMLPVLGGCGFIIVLLAILKLSGALEPGPADSVEKPAVAYVPPKANPSPTKKASEFYVERPSESGDLWIPPRDPVAWPLDHLPPGAQMFVHVQADFLESDSAKQIAASEVWRDQIASDILIGLSMVKSVNVAFYPPKQDGGPPGVAYRVALGEPISVDAFKGLLSDAPPAILNGKSVFANQRHAFWPHLRLETDAESTIRSFTVASIEQMKEAIDLGGEAAPMLPDVESLWELSDREADLSILVTPAFLFSDGRRVVESAPPRFARLLKEQLAEGIRSGLLQVSVDDLWYSELMLVGESPTAAAVLSQGISDRLKQLPMVVENWFVGESPDPHWAAIAFRFPQMLRSLASYTRTGIENGVAITNTYLPPNAAENLILATSIALQPTATVTGGPAMAAAQAQKPLTTEEYLNRRIRRINFAQEPIEVALEQIGDEANDALPEGTQPFQFILDGDAFESGGITRNQQLSDFDFSDIPVRDALTEVAKRGNPVTTVTDTREADQRLIWVVRDAETAQPKILLTTRAAAAAAGDELTVEFRQVEMRQE